MARTTIASLAAILAVVISVYYWSLPHDHPSDFAQAWIGARLWLAGQNPYEAIGPGRAFEYPWQTPYPFPAFLVALPFAVLPQRLADTCFIGAGAFGLAWVLTRERIANPQLLVFASFAFLHAAQYSQWQPLLVAGTFIPWLSPVLAAKPTIAAAIWIAYPSRWTLLGAAWLTLLSVLMAPWWIASWASTLAALTHVRPPITLWGGPLILLALMRWRLPEARLLVALACVPQSTFLYEAIPLFLIPRTWEQSALLAAGTIAVRIGFVLSAPYASYESQAWAMGYYMLAFLYLPCLVMVWRRCE